MVSETKTPLPNPLPVGRGEGTESARPVSLVSKRLRRDVAAELRAFKLDALHGGVGGGGRGAQTFAERTLAVSLSSPKGGEGRGEEANRFRN